MAPADMKFTWQDIIDGIFPSKEQLKKREDSKRVLHNLMGKFINEHHSKIPIEVLSKSDYVRDYHKWRVGSTHSKPFYIQIKKPHVYKMPYALWPLHKAPASVLKELFEEKELYVIKHDDGGSPVLKNKTHLLLEARTLKKLQRRFHLEAEK